MPQCARAARAKVATSSGGGQVVAAGDGGRAGALDLGLDHPDRREAGKARLAGMAAVANQPGDVAGHQVAADLDPAMVAVGGLQPVESCGRPILEVARDLGMEPGPVGLHGQEVVGLLGQDRPGDPGLTADGVACRAPGAARFATGSIAPRSMVTRAPASSSRSSSRGMAVISFALPATASWPSTSRWRLAHRPLADPTAEQPAPRRRRGRDEVQRVAALGASMAAARGLAVDGDEFRLVGAQSVDPGDEAVLEQLRVERVDHAIERVVRGDAIAVRQEAAQEGQPLLAPGLHLDQVVGAGQGRGQHQQQDLRQWEEHLRHLPWVRQRRETVQQGCARSGLGHVCLGQSSRHPMNHTKLSCGIPFLLITRASCDCPAGKSALT